jgi:hypothetical protein
MPSRRDSIRLGGCALVSLLSGCQSVLPDGRSRIDLKLYNYTDDRQPLIFELLRAGDHSYEDALVAEREFDVPPPSEDESAGVIYEEAFAKSRAYVVRVLLQNGDGKWFHHHFYPGESMTGRLDVRIYVDELTDRPYVRYQ